MKTKLSLFLVFFSIGIGISFAQGTNCADAIRIQSIGDNCGSAPKTMIPYPGGDMWMVFSANESSQVITLKSNNASEIKLIELFESDCSQLSPDQHVTQLGTAEAEMTMQNLTVGKDYFIKMNGNIHSKNEMIDVCLHGNKTAGPAVTQCLISIGLVSGNCKSIGNPYIESSCIAGIQRQIARSFNAEGINMLNLPMECWGMPNPNQSPVNCSAPYDKCWGQYCPEKYCQVIKSAVDAQASLILRAINTWGKDDWMYDGSSYVNSIKQLVLDINSVYDCAGLIRPVIQGSIFENCQITDKTVQIPRDVILHFSSNLGSEYNYYMDASGNPRTVFFTRSRINLPAGTYWGECPDITKIEAKMWFYHLARLQIDAGITSIHMGQMRAWGSNDPMKIHCSFIVKDIRQYAQDKKSFVLLTEENYKALKFPGTEVFMFDYDSRALRPREVSNQIQLCGDYNCSAPVQNYLTGSPCANETYKAIIDFCVVNQQGNQPGISPTNGCRMPMQPYNTYFDFGMGIHPPAGVISSGCQGQFNAQDGTWGWDDTKWFAEKISSSCREFWMTDGICRIGNWTPGFSFMTAPGYLAVKKPENYNNQYPNPIADGAYIMSDEYNVQHAVENAWSPSNQLTITVNKQCNIFLGYCKVLPPIQRRLNTYTIQIDQTDCSSIYTIHVQDPNGNWLPMSYGKTRQINPLITGTYKVYIRQDNLGRLNGSNGYGSKTVMYNVHMFVGCCGNQNFYPTEPEIFHAEEYEGNVLSKSGDDFSAYHEYIKKNKFEVLEPSSEDIGTATLNEVAASEEFDVLVNIHPNPTNGLINLELQSKTSGEGQLKIYDNVGKLVFTQAYLFHNEINNLELNLEHLPAAVYTLEIEINQQVTRHKISKM